MVKGRGGTAGRDLDDSKTGMMSLRATRARTVRLGLRQREDTKNGRNLYQ